MFRENIFNLHTLFFDIETTFRIKEKEDKEIRRTQFLSAKFQKDKRGIICGVVFQER